MPRGEASYYDLLGADAFGNFRQFLEDVTLNPMMGQFLSMQGNDKGNATTDPDENYAREVMQLFTIGLWKLNDDGSQQLDSTGNPIPTYSNTDVKGPRRCLHRLELEHSRRLFRITPGPTAASTSDPATVRNCCPCRASQITTRQSKRTSSALPFPPQAAPIPPAISKSLSTRFSIIPICPRFSPSS